jgi:aryl-alcohol dehydrogenase-like predicted oxidoreductase
VSPVGVGTYKGSFDDSDDLSMFNGIVDSVLLGCNVIDTCRNFRKGRSENVVKLALKYLLEK